MRPSWIPLGGASRDPASSSATVEPSPTRAFWSAYGRTVLILLGVLAAVAVAAAVLPSITDRTEHVWGGGVASRVVSGWSRTVLHPEYWAFLIVVGLVELRWPARVGEGVFSVGGAQDLGWFLLTPIFTFTVMYWSVDLVSDLHDGPLHGASLNLSSKIGTIPTVIAVIVVADFFLWLSHFLRHKIPPLWRFHQVHHSQTQISPLTDKRFHFIEPLMFVAIALIPAALLGLNFGSTQLLVLALVYATGFTHANLRWNAGALGWLFVTPQSHRVHHSTEERHWERNFGAVLSIWDRMFRTHWHGTDDYPTIGIDDTAFPLERKPGPVPVVHNYFRQVVYPFTRVATDARKS